MLAVNNGEVKTLLFGVLFTTVTTTTTTILDWRTDPPMRVQCVYFKMFTWQSDDRVPWIWTQVSVKIFRDYFNIF